LLLIPIDLTPRELDILILLSQGLQYNDIAQRLHISRETVKFHARNLFLEMTANNAAHAVAIGYQRGILPSQGRLF